MRKTTTTPGYHVAVSSLDLETGVLTTTYLGTVDQAHVDQVRQTAALDEPSRWLRESCRTPGAFFVLRSEDDGTDYDLDSYVPVDTPPFVIRTPDPNGATEVNLGGDLARSQAKGPTSVRTKPRSSMPMGATGPAYIDGAVRFGDGSIGGAMDHPESGARFTWHTTESPSGGAYFAGVAAYLIHVASEPQVIYDPATDRIGQFGPLHQSGRALRNDGARRTNREGRVNIQVEVLGRAARPWTEGFDPAGKPNFGKLLAAGRAWGIPDVWPAGNPPASPGGSNPRSRTVWQSKAGHYGHSQVPGNDHDDPGAIDTSIVPGKSTPAPGPAPVPVPDGNAFPGASRFGPGANNAYVTRLGAMLVARGAGRFYRQGPGPTWGDADRNACQAFQQAQGWTGSEADGIPGPATWQLLVTGKGHDIPAAKPTPPVLEPFPSAAFFHAGRNSPIITAMGRRLVAEGCGRYATGPGPNWTTADRDSYAQWQRKCGYSGSSADGVPGKATWDKLRVPKQ